MSDADTSLPLATDPTDLTPREAKEMFLDRRSVDASEATLQTIHYRLKRWVLWCEENGINTLDDLSGWVFEAYQNARRGDDLAPYTLHQHIHSLKRHVEWLESIEAVEGGLAEKIDVPKVNRRQESNDTRLEPDRALGLIEHYRETEYGSRRHALLELLWFTACRLGSVRALDRRDFDAEEGYVHFHHRPESGTPLKNKASGERVVSLPEATVDVLDAYLSSRDRWDTHDDHGRRPLLTSRQGRLGKNSVRCLCYLATVPCRNGACPHDKDPDTCEWLDRTHISKCPSSRSPHQVRTGSITWQLNQGVPVEVVSERANVGPDVIEQHYDKEDPVREMRERRSAFTSNLELDHE
jgi:integrase